MNLELDLIRPLRAAVRALARSRSFTLTAILSVGGAIGLAASVHAVIAATFFAPLPWTDPDGLVEFWQTPSPTSTQAVDYLQPTRMEEWVGGQFRTMTEVAAAGSGPTLVVRGDGSGGGDGRASGGARRVDSAPILGDWFGVMGVQAARGRVLTTDDLRPGAPRTAVVSHAFWKADLSGGELGTVFLSGAAYSVVGVMPARVTTERVVWVPVESLPSGVRPAVYAGVGRLRAGMSAQDAAREVQRLAANQVRADSARFAGLGATARSVTSVARTRSRPQLWMLAGVVAAVLLVALNNLTVLTMVRAESRSTDLAVRAALGADRWELARSLAMEGILIGVCGAGVGLIVASWGKDFAAAFIGGSGPPPVIGPGTIAVAVGLGVLVAASLALIPMQRVKGMDLRSWLQRGGGGVGTTPSERRTRQTLVAGQVAVAVVLVSITAVVGSAYRALSTTDVGFDASRVVEANPDWRLSGYSSPDRQWAMADRIMARIEPSPEVAATAAWQQLGQVYPAPPGSDAVTDGPAVELGTFDGLYRYYEVTPGFFETLGVDLRAGRAFRDQDGGAESVAIITQRGAELWWPGENPLGRQIKLGQAGEWMTVVGVASDIRQLNMLGKLSTVRPARSRMMPLLFMPAGQFDSPPAGWGGNEYWEGVRIGARAAGAVGGATRVLREIVSEEAPDLAFSSLGPLHDSQMQAGDTLALTGRFLGAALLAVLGLSLVGVVGVVTESIARRTREVGLRVALGADEVRVAWTVARESIYTAAVGVGVGVLALVLMNGWLQAVVFDYFANRLGPDLLTARVLGLAVGAVSIVALTAILLVSRRALGINPIEALRAD